MIRAASRRLSPLLLLAAALVAMTTLPLLNPPGAHGQGQNEPASVAYIKVTREPDPGIGCTTLVHYEDWLPRGNPCRIPIDGRLAYGIDDVIQMTVTFTLPVVVTGTPQLNLTIGDSTKAADYKSHEQKEVVFEYRVVQGDYDHDGIAVADDATLLLNGGTITTERNGRDADLYLNYSGRELRARNRHMVDTITPRLLNVSIDRPSPIVQWTGNYRAGDEIIINLEFDEPIYFSRLPTIPSATLTHASVGVLFGENESRTWEYHDTGSMDNSVVSFKYTVQKGDVDADGLSLPANAIYLNGGVIRDGGGNQPSLNHPAVEGDNRPVDGNRSIVPVVESLAITSDPGDDDTYRLGDDIEVTATFTRNVMPVRGVHSRRNNGVSEQRIELDIGGQARTARISGNDGRKVRFNYMVQPDDMDDNGISVKANSLSWRGTIYEVEGESNEPYWDSTEPDWDRLVFLFRDIPDAYGDVNAVISHDAISDDDGHMVDGAPNAPATGVPTISGTAQVGQTLTVDTSGISDADGLDNVSYRYTWISKDVNGHPHVSVSAKDATYTLTNAHLGHTVLVNVSFTDDAGHSEKLDSSPTAWVGGAPNALATGVPTISGTAQVGQTLTVDTSGISDADGLDNVSYRYMWSSNDGNGHTYAWVCPLCANFTLTNAHLGHTVKVNVSFTDDVGHSERLTSDATAAVAGPVNNPPMVSKAIPDSTIVNEIGTHGVPLSSMFRDADGDELAITASSSDESVATVSVSADYSTLTVTAKSRGTATITVTASDGYGGSVKDSFTVKVKAAPVVASAIADATMVEVSSKELALSTVFSDADGDTLTFTVSSTDQDAVAVYEFHGTLTVLAIAGSKETITVTAQDSDGNRVSDAFTVTVVAPPNNAPAVSSAIADAIIVNESGTQTVSLTGVFYDADADDLTVTASSSDESVATVSVASDQTRLTVTAQARGTATITVTAADGNSGTVDDTFTVRVKAAPVVASAIDDVSELEVDATHEVSMSGVFSDADGDRVTVTEASSSDSAIAAVSAAIDGSTAAITAVTVTGKSEGTAIITVTAQDSDGNTVSDAFDVTVNAPAAQQQRAVELPGPVVGLELAATHDSVSVSWSAPESGDAPDGYIVNIKRQGGGDGETRRPGAGKTSLTFRDLNSGSTYEVWVRAQNEAGKGERVKASITLPSVLPGPVTGLEVVATGDGVTVSWSAPETGGAPDGYIVHIRPEGGAEGSGRTKTPKAKKTKVSFENLESGQTYQVWVRAQNPAGKGERVHASITLPEAEAPPENGDGQKGQ